MNVPTFASLLLLSLCAPLFAGCADAGNTVAGEEANLVRTTDAALEVELKAALVGLETSGSEGDPDPYKLTTLSLAPGEAITDAVLLEKLLPKLEGVVRNDDPLAGVDRKPAAEVWQDLTAEPRAEDFANNVDLAKEREMVTRWRKLKTIVDGKLRNIVTVDIGYRTSENGSLETGAVAHVILGQSETGRLYAMWGIDIWT